ncbi:6-phosphogluconolactonase [soil metagenome]
MKLNIFDTVDEVLAGLAAYFIKTANEAIAEHGHFSVALSGGSSPKKLYSLLASETYKDQLDWTKIYFFFGDERYVPDTNPASNYQMAKKVLFEPLVINPEHIFAVNTLLSPQEAAEQYMHTISTFFKGNDPRFDLVLLGLGDNSHTASLFPYTSVLHEVDATVKPVFLTDQQVYRITFTASLINKAHHIAFLVYGESKAMAIHNVLEEDVDTQNYPAQLIHPFNGVPPEWFVDKPAVKNLQ